MHWKLILSQTKGTIELWKNEILLAKREWIENRNTSQDILSAMASIRTEQNLEWSTVAEFKLDLDLSPHATARRIAETFQNTYTTFVAKV